MPKKESEQKYRFGNQIWAPYTFMDSKTKRENSSRMERKNEGKGEMFMNFVTEIDRIFTQNCAKTFYFVAFCKILIKWISIT